MKRCSLIGLLVVLLILVGCGEDKIRPIESSTVDFDLKSAKALIETGERVIVNLEKCKVISKSEYETFFSEMKKAYGDEEEMFKFFFDNVEFENPNTEVFTVQPHMFYPTSLHKDIEVTSASVTKETYENAFFNTEFLTILIEYTGEDEVLKGFSREYIYSKKADGTWEFHCFGGTINYADANYSPTYLELK